MERLKGIEEAGSLFSSLSDGVCPLCGAEPAHQHKSEDCEGNPEQIVLAAQAEIAKIILLQDDLSKTIAQLATESKSLERRLPRLEVNIDELSVFIESQVSPNLRAMRLSYSELADKKAEVREALGLYRTLKDLQDRKTVLEAEVERSSRYSHRPSEEASMPTREESPLACSALPTPIEVGVNHSLAVQ